VHQEEPVKLQTLSLGAKLGVLTTPNSRYYGPVQQLISYLLALAKQDRSINVRDRTRFLETLLMGAGVIEPFKRQDRTSWDEPEEASPSMVDVGGVKLRREQVRVVLLEGVRSVPLQVEGWP
jgi:AP-3 complex subunit beta